MTQGMFAWLVSSNDGSRSGVMHEKPAELVEKYLNMGHHSARSPRVGAGPPSLTEMYP